MIALVGGTRKVIGSKIATPFTDPKPGIAPMNKPTITPITTTTRFIGWNAMAKPSRRSAMISIFFLVHF